LLGFENFELWLLRFDNFELWTKGALSVRGTSGSETLDIAAARIDLDLGDGRDSVHLMRIGRGAAGVIDLGPGKDSMSAGAARRLVGDLARGRLVLKDSARLRASLAMLGVEQFYGSAPRMVLRGGPEANRLLGDGCRVRLRGGAGADHLKALTSRRCVTLLTGGPGPDRLFGGLGDDRLLGGPGRDRADGLSGTDTCRAEREAHCER
jgi:Ca2+-binding RTX toxin-like protein